jgi:protein gp37
MNKQGKGKIEYLDYTWNPVTDCRHPCKDQYCYAKTIAQRFGSGTDDGAIHYLGEPMDKQKRNGLAAYGSDTMIDPYPFGFAPTFHRYRMDEPHKVKKPSVIGVVYMGDLFGKWVPDVWIKEVFEACEKAPWHKYIFLTKNPLRYSELNNGMGVPDKSNFWYGSTVTKKGDPFACIKTPRLHRSHYFVSIEPLLEVPADLSTLAYANWVIIGQQTGPGAKPPKPEWVQSIIDQCKAAGVPVFVKSPLYEKFPIQEWPEGLK